MSRCEGVLGRQTHAIGKGESKVAKVGTIVHISLSERRGALLIWVRPRVWGLGVEGGRNKSNQKIKGWLRVQIADKRRKSGRNGSGLREQQPEKKNPTPDGYQSGSRTSSLQYLTRSERLRCALSFNTLSKLKRTRAFESG